MSAQQAYPQVIPALLIALTPIHVGVGQAPGVVDLPVARDPLGYPYIPGSALKGAVKSELARASGCVSRKGQGGDEGSVRCDGDCSWICEALGRDPEPEAAPEAASAVGFLDFYPLLTPMASLDRGLLMVTTPLLLSKFAELLELAGLGGLAGELRGAARLSVGRCGGEQAMLYTFNDKVLGLCRVDGVTKLLAGASSALEAALRSAADGRLAVVSDADYLSLVDRALVRLTRVRLSRATKTVVRGALWTEEYLPQLTVLAGAIVIDQGVGAAGSVGRFLEAVEKAPLVVVGGRETIGKGLAKLQLITGWSGGEAA